MQSQRSPGRSTSAAVSGEASVAILSRCRTPSIRSRSNVFSCRSAPSTANGCTTVVVGHGSVSVFRLIVRVVIELESSALLRNQVAEEVWDRAVALDEHVDKVLGDVLVAIIVEGGGEALMADTSRAADAMHIFADAAIGAGWQVVVDDVLDIFNIPASRRDAGRN